MRTYPPIVVQSVTHDNYRTSSISYHNCNSGQILGRILLNKALETKGIDQY